MKRPRRTRNCCQRSNYLDPDVAYLLGLIVGRGSITDSAENRRLIIDFPFRALQAKGTTKTYEQKVHLNVAVNEIRNRIEQLVEASFDIVTTPSNVQFVMRFLKNSMTWRNILLITEGNRSYRDNVVPERIFGSPPEIQKEFVRGLADVCGFVRNANAFHGRHRVYIEIPAQNWRLPISLCRLLQVNLRVPVQLIQWNHPNTRITNAPSAKLTSREHQIKIFADAFLPIGFYVRYKQEILEELAEHNRGSYSEPHPCNPNPEVHPDKHKPKHSEEKSKMIPKCIRGKHFNSYWQICTALECKQYRDVNPGQKKLFRKEDEDDAETDQG